MNAPENNTNTERNGDASMALFKNAFKGTIKIEEGRRVFGPGDYIRGSVLVETRKSSDIHLHVLLYGKVRLFDCAEGYGYRKIVNMFNYKLILLGEAEKSVHIPPGTLDLPFEFQMPQSSLPASFCSKKGKIEYGIRVFFQTPRHNTSHKIELTVPSCVDQFDPEFNYPLTVSKCGLSGNKIWGGGHFEVSATIPRRSFETESSVPVSLHIRNHSAHSLKLKSVTLKQIVGEPDQERKDAETVEKTQRLVFNEEFPSELREIKRLVRVPIPPTSVMSPDISTKILTVRHEIEIKVQSSCRFSKVMKLRIPVVIAGFPRDCYFTSLEAQNVDALPLYVCEALDDRSPLNRCRSESFQDSFSTGTDIADLSDDISINTTTWNDGVSQSDAGTFIAPRSTQILSECDTDFEDY